MRIILALIAAFSYASPSLAQTSGADTVDPAQVFRDWRLQCERDSKRCFIYQRTDLQKTGQQVLGVVVGNLGPKGEHIIHLTIPLGIYIPPGVALKIDDGEQISLSVHTCSPKGCEAMINMEQSLLSALQKGKAANIAFLDAVTRRQITVGVSLMGFGDAYAALRRRLSLR